MQKYCGGLVTGGIEEFAALSEQKKAYINALYNAFRESGVLGALPDHKDVGDQVKELKSKIPNPNVNRKTWTANKASQEGACKKIASIINGIFGQVISPDDPNDVMCDKAAELLMAMTTGTQAEYLGVSETIKKSVENLVILLKFLEITKQGFLADVAQADISISKKWTDAFTYVETEMKRQLLMFRSMLDQMNDLSEIEKLVKDNEKIKSFIKGVTSSSLGKQDYGNKIAFLFTMFGSTADIAKKVNESLKLLGISAKSYKEIVDNYVKFRDELSEAFVNKLPEMKDNNNIKKLLNAIEYLERSFIVRDEIRDLISDSVSGRGEIMLGGAEGKLGGDPKLAKKIDSNLKMRKALLLMFTRNAADIISKLMHTANELSKFIKTGQIKELDKLEDLARSVDLLPSLSDRQLYARLSGFYYDNIGAKQTREDFIKILEINIHVCGEMHKHYGQQLFKDMQSLFEEFKKVIEVYNEKFSEYRIADRVGAEDDLAEITGSAEGGADEPIIPQINRVAYDFNRFIEDVKYTVRISKIRQNLGKAPQELETYGADYMKVLGQAIAREIDELNKEIVKYQEPLGVNSGNPLKDAVAWLGQNGTITTAVPANTYDQAIATPEVKVKAYIDELVIPSLRANITLLQTAESVDLYLKNFTIGINADPDAIRDIAFMLENTEIITKWFTNRSGDAICRLFEEFPYYNKVIAGADGNPKYENEYNRVGVADVTDHYYVKIAALLRIGDIDKIGTDHTGYELDSTIKKKKAGGVLNVATYFGGVAPAIDGLPGVVAEGLPGLPLLYRRHDKVLLDRLDEVLNITMLKNIVSMFVNIGSKFNGKSLTDASYIPPEQVYRNIMNYVKYSSIDFGYGAIGTVPAPGNGSRVIATGIEKKYLLNKGYVTDAGGVANLTQTLSNATGNIAYADTTINQNTVGISVGLRNSIGSVVGTEMRGRLAEANLTGYMMAPIPGFLDNDNAVKTESPAYSESSGVKRHVCDEVFIMMVKSMVSKVFVTIGVFNMLNKPAEKGSGIGFNTKLRMILGSDDVKIIPEALPLYVRLPLMAEFYRIIFKFDQVLADKERFMTVIPDMDGTFSGFASITFGRLKNVIGGLYSETDIRLLIEEINKLYAKFKTEKDPVNACIDAYIYDVNRRYGIINKETRDKYNQFMDSRMSEYSTLDRDEVDYTLIGMENNARINKLTPSTNYLRPNLATIPDSPYKYELQLEDNKRLVNKLRRDIDEFFEGATEVRDPEKEKVSAIDKISFVSIIRTAELELKDAKTDEEKYRSIVSTMLNLGQFNFSHLEKAIIAFHETVMTPLNLLHQIYVRLRDIHLGVHEIYRVVRGVTELTGKIAAGGGVFFKAVALTNDNESLLTRLLYNTHIDNTKFAGGGAVLPYLNQGTEKRYANNVPFLIGDEHIESVRAGGIGDNNALVCVGHVLQAIVQSGAISQANKAELVLKYILNNELVAKDTFDLLFSLSDGFDKLVKVKLDSNLNEEGNVVSTAAMIYMADLFDHIKKTMEIVKANFNSFREVLPKELLHYVHCGRNGSIEKPESGSIVYVETQLIHKLIMGRNPLKSDGIDVKYSFDVDVRDYTSKYMFTVGNESIEKISEKVSYILKHLSRKYKVSLDQTIIANPAVATDAMVTANKVLDRVARQDGGKVASETYYSYYHLIYSMVFYDFNRLFAFADGTTNANANAIVKTNGAGAGERSSAPFTMSNVLCGGMHNVNSDVTNTQFHSRNRFAFVNLSKNPYTGFMIQRSTDPGSELREATLGYTKLLPSLNSDELYTQDSVLLLFNQLALTYFNTMIDRSYQKVYITAVKTLMSGVVGAAVQTGSFYNDGSTYPVNTVLSPNTPGHYKVSHELWGRIGAQPWKGDFILTNNEPPLRGVMFKSVGTLYHYIFNMPAREPGQRAYIVEDINLFPPFLKENYKQRMPILLRLFTALIEKCSLLKQLIQVLNIEQMSDIGIIGNTAALNRAGRNSSQGIFAAQQKKHPDHYINPADGELGETGFGVDFAHREDHWRGALEKRTNLQNKANMSEILDNIIMYSTSFIQSITDTLKEFVSMPKYLELYDGFNKSYEISGSQPFAPLSTSLCIFRSNSGRYNYAQSFPFFGNRAFGTPEWKFCYGNRLIGRSLVADDFVGVKRILADYNVANEPRLHITDKVFGDLLGSYKLLYSYMYDMRTAKAMMIGAGLLTADQFQGDRYMIDAAAVTAAGLNNAVKKLGGRVAVDHDNPRAIPPVIAANEANAVFPEFNKLEKELGNVHVYQLQDAVAIPGIIALTENIDKFASKQKIVKYLTKPTVSGSQRERLIAFNIIDLNKVPINIHALMKDVPLVNLINYAYTFDKYVERYIATPDFNGLAPDGKKRKDHGSSIRNDSINEGLDMIRTRDLLAKLTIDPYANMTYAYYWLMFGKLVRGDIDLDGVSRPKYIAEEIYNKPLFGEVFMAPPEKDEIAPMIGFQKQIDFARSDLDAAVIRTHTIDDKVRFYVGLFEQYLDKLITQLRAYDAAMTALGTALVPPAFEEFTAGNRDKDIIVGGKLNAAVVLGISNAIKNYLIDMIDDAFVKSMLGVINTPVAGYMVADAPANRANDRDSILLVIQVIQYLIKRNIHSMSLARITDVQKFIYKLSEYMLNMFPPGNARATKKSKAFETDVVAVNRVVNTVTYNFTGDVDLAYCVDRAFGTIYPKVTKPIGLFGTLENIFLGFRADTVDISDFQDDVAASTCFLTGHVIQVAKINHPGRSSITSNGGVDIFGRDAETYQSIFLNTAPALLPAAAALQPNLDDLNFYRINTKCTFTYGNPNRIVAPGANVNQQTSIGYAIHLIKHYISKAGWISVDNIISTPHTTMMHLALKAYINLGYKNLISEIMNARDESSIKNALTFRLIRAINVIAFGGGGAHGAAIGRDPGTGVYGEVSALAGNATPLRIKILINTLLAWHVPFLTNLNGDKYLTGSNAANLWGLEADLFDADKGLGKALGFGPLRQATPFASANPLNRKYAIPGSTFSSPYLMQTDWAGLIESMVDAGYLNDVGFNTPHGRYSANKLDDATPYNIYDAYMASMRNSIKRDIDLYRTPLAPGRAAEMNLEYVKHLMYVTLYCLGVIRQMTRVYTVPATPRQPAVGNYYSGDELASYDAIVDADSAATAHGAAAANESISVRHVEDPAVAAIKNQAKTIINACNLIYAVSLILGGATVDETIATVYDSAGGGFVHRQYTTGAKIDTSRNVVSAAGKVQLNRAFYLFTPITVSHLAESYMFILTKLHMTSLPFIPEYIGRFIEGTAYTDNEAPMATYAFLRVQARRRYLENDNAIGTGADRNSSAMARATSFVYNGSCNVNNYLAGNTHNTDPEPSRKIEIVSNIATYKSQLKTPVFVIANRGQAFGGAPADAAFYDNGIVHISDRGIVYEFNLTRSKFPAGLDTNALNKYLIDLAMIPGSPFNNNYLHYPYRDTKTGETKVARVHVGEFKNMLQYIGYMRFNTKLIRNLIWFANLQRVTRYVLRTHLFWYDTKIVNSNPVLAITNTENSFNRLHTNQPEDEGY